MIGLMKLKAKCVQNEKRGDLHTVVFYLDKEQSVYVTGKIELRMDPANAEIFQKGEEYSLDFTDESWV